MLPMKKRNGLVGECIIAQVEPVAGVGGVAVDAHWCFQLNRMWRVGGKTKSMFVLLLFFSIVCVVVCGYCSSNAWRVTAFVRRCGRKN